MYTIFWLAIYKQSLNIFIFFIWHPLLCIAAKCSLYKPLKERGSNRGRESEGISIFFLYSKNLQATHAIPENLWPYPTFFLRMHFWDTQYKIFLFALIKKFFLQTLVEIIFKYDLIWDPPTNKMKQNFTYEVLGIKLG